MNCENNEEDWRKDIRYIGLSKVMTITYWCLNVIIRLKWLKFIYSKEVYEYGCRLSMINNKKSLNLNDFAYMSSQKLNGEKIFNLSLFWYGISENYINRQALFACFYRQALFVCFCNINMISIMKYLHSSSYKTITLNHKYSCMVLHINNF